MKLTGAILQWGDLTCIPMCDSTGLSARYCTYSLMGMQTQQIVSFVNIKVTETGSSSKMEIEGFRRCMVYLLDEGFHIEVLANDRYVQIQSGSMS